MQKDSPLKNKDNDRIIIDLSECEVEEHESLNSNDNVYTIEEILDHKMSASGEDFYLIKWIGYPSEENTWEPYANLQDCLNLVKAYNNKIKKSKAKFKSVVNKDRIDLRFDTPKLLTYCIYKFRKIYYKVSWNKREDGYTPKESFVEHNILYRYFPLILLDFYEARLLNGNLKLNQISSQ